MKDIKEKFSDFNFLLLMIASLVVFGVLIYSVSSIISPIIIFLILLIILFPLRSNKFASSLLWSSLLLFFIWMFDELGEILLPFIIAFILAYILDPVLDKLQNRNISRTLSAAIIMIGVSIFIGMIIAFVVPPFFGQITNLISAAPQFASNFQFWIQNNLLVFLEKLGLPKEAIETYIISNVSAKIEEILTSILNGFLNIFGSIGTVLNQLVNLFIIPILTFYILKDFDFILENFKNLFPKRFHQSMEDYTAKINKIVGSYLRGALIVCLINAAVITTFLSIIGVRYSFVLGILSGVFCFIPYFGVLISFSIGFIVALFSGLAPISLLLVPILYFGENLLESSIFYPKIVGSQIGMHPAMLILSLFVFSYFLGLVGMLIAVPTTSIILLIVSERIEKRDLKTL